MWNKVFIFLFLFISYQTASQTTVLEQDVSKQLEQLDVGPANSKHLTFSNTNYGFQYASLYENDSLRVRSGSFVLNFGGEELWKLSNKIYLGYNTGFQYSSYRIKQDSGVNLLSINLEHESQKLRIFHFDLGPVLRINIGKKGGNKISQFVELSGYGLINFGYSLKSKDDVDPAFNQGAKEVQVTQKKLSYINRWGYGTQVKIGWNMINIWAKYRLSDSFTVSTDINNNIQLPELPRLSLGIGFSILKPNAEDK